MAAALVADGHGIGIDHPGQLLHRQHLWLMRRAKQSTKPVQSAAPTVLLSEPSMRTSELELITSRTERGMHRIDSKTG